MSRIELPEGMAVGFRFYPTDEELIRSYLEPKLLGRHSEVDHVVAEVEFSKFEPWELPIKSKMKSKDRMWFFFCVQNLKFGSNKSSKKKGDETGIWKITGRRKTETGTWKITGVERMIKDQDTKECIGKKRTLVFYKGPTPGEKTNWVMQLYYVIPDHPLPNQRTHVLCRLKEKASDKANTLDPEEGEPSNDITSEVENPVTPAVISTAHDLEEVNQQSLPHPSYSPVCHLTDEEISLLESVGFLQGHDNMQALCGAGEPEEPPKETDAEGVEERPYFPDAPASSDTDTEVVDGQRPYALCHLENKTDKKAGTLGFDEGETSGGDNISDVENPEAPAAISEAYGHAEVNTDSLLQAFLSPDCYLTGEDIDLIFSDNFEDDQNINSVMHKYHPKPENSLPRQGLNVISGLDNRTDENGSTQGCDIGGEPSGHITSDTENQVPAAATLEIHSDTEVSGESLSLPLLSPDCYITEKDMSLIFSNNFHDYHNKRQALRGADESEESPQQFLNGHKANNCEETMNNLFNDSIQPKSLKRSYTDVERVDGRAKRSCSLAPGE